MKNKLLITGGAGFIGSCFIKYLLNQLELDDVFIVNFDKLTYSGNLSNLEEVKNHRNYKFIKGDICDSELVNKVIEENDINGIINFAAESHVDRSILNSKPFADTNIIGTINLLEAARRYSIAKFLQISTDEVYGSLGESGAFTEVSQIKPNSPYSASKAAADHFVTAYFKTYNLPVLITRCSNNYGPNQFPEKLIPLIRSNALENKKIPVYGDGLNIRDWIYVYDHCQAVWTVFEHGVIGSVYNIGANSELTNLEVVKTILKELNKSEDLIEFVKDRPGHDKRYAMDNTKISTELNWHPKVDFEKGIELTIKWYLNNLNWTNEIRSGEYLNFYKTLYGKEL